MNLDRKELIEHAAEYAHRPEEYALIAIAIAVGELVDKLPPASLPGWVEVTTSDDFPQRVFLPAKELGEK